MSILIKHFTFNYISQFAHGDTSFHRGDFQKAAVLVWLSYVGKLLVKMTHVGKTQSFLRFDRWGVIFKNRIVAGFLDLGINFKVSEIKDHPKPIEGQSFD